MSVDFICWFRLLPICIEKGVSLRCFGLLSDVIVDHIQKVSEKRAKMHSITSWEKLYWEQALVTSKMFYCVLFQEKRIWIVGPGKKGFVRFKLVVGNQASSDGESGWGEIDGRCTVTFEHSRVLWVRKPHSINTDFQNFTFLHITKERLSYIDGKVMPRDNDKLVHHRGASQEIYDAQCEWQRCAHWFKSQKPLPLDVAPDSEHLFSDSHEKAAVYRGGHSETELCFPMIKGQRRETSTSEI